MYLEFSFFATKRIIEFEENTNIAANTKFYD